jgi:hypothetical protein
VLVMAVTCKRVSEICAAAEFCSVLFDILWQISINNIWNHGNKKQREPGTVVHTPNPH